MPKPIVSASDIDSWPYHTLQAEAAKHSIRRNLGAAKLRTAIKHALADNGNTAGLPREWLIVSDLPQATAAPCIPSQRLKRTNSQLTSDGKPLQPPPVQLRISVQESKNADQPNKIQDHIPHRPTIQPRRTPRRLNQKKLLNSNHSNPVKQSQPFRKPFYNIPTHQSSNLPAPSRPPVDQPPQSSHKDSSDTPLTNPSQPQPLPQKANSPLPADQPNQNSDEFLDALRLQTSKLGLADLVSPSDLTALTSFIRQTLQTLASGSSLMDAIKNSCSNFKSDQNESLSNSKLPDLHILRSSSSSIRWALPLDKDIPSAKDESAIHSLESQARRLLDPTLDLARRLELRHQRRLISTPARSGEFAMIKTPNLPDLSTILPPQANVPRELIDWDDITEDLFVHQSSQPQLPQNFTQSDNPITHPQSIIQSQNDLSNKQWDNSSDDSLDQLKSSSPKSHQISTTTTQSQIVPVDKRLSRLDNHQIDHLDGPSRKKIKLEQATSHTIQNEELPIVESATALTPIDEGLEQGSSAPSNSRHPSTPPPHQPDGVTTGPPQRTITLLSNFKPEQLNVHDFRLFPINKPQQGAKLLGRPPPTQVEPLSPNSKTTLFGTEDLYGDRTSQPFGEMFYRGKTRLFPLEETLSKQEK
ncbi:hypothetical protein O181_061425 [Austropuccinia psidii MF-1]|uniref:Uncharacterized protein n=1 Tax=Austropuccinia psidii MF-1 TaxID=1389203 RepID=A0A9Q3I0G6_9BASI|nr:hypothetical protein [Austropuccinia psidii MF-1]